MTKCGDTMDKFYNIIEKEHISLKYRDLRKERESLYGLYVCDEIAGPVIILDQSLRYSTRMQRSVVAEEVGHYYTAPRTNYLTVYTSYSTELTMSQDEQKALKWATDFLIPDDQLITAIKADNNSCFELAEYFNVTEWFIHRKLEFLRQTLNKMSLNINY